MIQTDSLLQHLKLLLLCAQSLLELLDLLVAVFEFFVQALNRSQRHAIRVDRGNGFVVFTNAKGGVKVLRHRADVANGAAAP